MSKQICTSPCCKTPVSPRMIFCWEHWSKLSRSHKAKLFNNILFSFEPSRHFLASVFECSAEIAVQENRIDVAKICNEIVSMYRS